MKRGRKKKEVNISNENITVDENIESVSEQEILVGEVIASATETESISETILNYEKFTEISENVDVVIEDEVNIKNALRDELDFSGLLKITSPTIDEEHEKSKDVMISELKENLDSGSLKIADIPELLLEIEKFELKIQPIKRYMKNGVLPPDKKLTSVMGNIKIPN